MLYPQNGDRFGVTDSVTSLHLGYIAMRESFNVGTVQTKRFRAVDV